MSENEETRIILISGKQGSGKSTLSHELGLRFNKAGWRVFHPKFAAAIYRMHDQCLAVLRDLGIETLKKDGTLLQLLGTEWGRATLGKDIWVECLKGQISNDLRLTLARKRMFIIDDCRFTNEFEAFPGALTVRLECSRNRRKIRCPTWRNNDKHESETALDEYAIKDRFSLTLPTGVMSKDEAVQHVFDRVTWG